MIADIYLEGSWGAMKLMVELLPQPVQSKYITHLQTRVRPSRSRERLSYESNTGTTPNPLRTAEYPGLRLSTYEYAMLWTACPWIILVR